MAKGKWSLILASSLVLTLGACSEEEPKEPIEVKTDVVENLTKQDNVENDVTDVEEKEDTSDRTVTSGIYIGEADGNTIEIESHEAFQIYHLSDGVKKVVSDIKPESDINFTYYQNKEGKNVILEIQVIKGPNVEVIAEKDESPKVVSKEWGFIGMIDGHSAEFEKDGKSIVAQYGPEQLEVINQLNENDLVAVEFHENQHGQYVLESIVKK